MILSRRSLITGLASFIAAPAIVRASSIMPVKAWAPYSDNVAINLLPCPTNVAELTDRFRLLQEAREEFYRFAARQLELMAAQS